MASRQPILGWGFPAPPPQGSGTPPRESTCLAAGSWIGSAQSTKGIQAAEPGKNLKRVLPNRNQTETPRSSRMTAKDKGKQSGPCSQRRGRMETTNTSPAAAERFTKSSYIF